MENKIEFIMSTYHNISRNEMNYQVVYYEEIKNSTEQCTFKLSSGEEFFRRVVTRATRGDLIVEIEKICKINNAKAVIDFQ